MDKKVYEKTRYQNIYRHKKNKNYVIMMSKPVKTSISRVDGKKIMTTDDAIKVRDNIALKKQKAIETLHKESFDELWDKYTFYCKNVKKLAYKTMKRKISIYSCYLKGKIKTPLSKTNRDFWADYLNNCECSNKQKNEILKELKAFIGWCVSEEYLISNPVLNIPKYKVIKKEMRYWLPSQFESFMKEVDKDLNSPILRIRTKAYLIKILTLLGFFLGDRPGESRALTFKIGETYDGTIRIEHSINQDSNSDNFLDFTKTYASQRNAEAPKKLIEEINKYKKFLIEEKGYSINRDTIIIFNHKTNRPYWDSTLRKYFYYYCDKAGVPRIRMYDLRHTYVATMMAEGVPLYFISSQIGHKDYSTTVNVYGHLSNDARKEIAKKIDKYY